MKRILHLCLITVCSIVFIVIILFLALVIQSPGIPRPFTDKEGKKVPGSIAVINTVNINGLDQKMIIRGRDSTKPVLLYLHGGPGDPEFPFVRQYNSGIEDLFVVCYWDQRGAGMSYDNNIDPATMTVPQFVDDAGKVAGYLIKRFNRNKIFLLGHSWGTLLGAFTVQKYPEYFYAFIAVGQVGKQEESEIISYHYVLSKAIQARDNRAANILRKAGPPPYSDPEKSILNLRIERRYVTRYGGAVRNGRFYLGALKALFVCREYRLVDKINYLKGMNLTVKYLWDPIMKSDLFRDVPSQQIPVYIMQGLYDYQTAYVVAKEYFDKLRAPVKKFFTFKNSAHSPIFEEPFRFEQILKEIIAESGPVQSNSNK